MSRSDRAIGIVLGIALGIAVLIVFVFLISGEIDSPSLDPGEQPLRERSEGVQAGPSVALPVAGEGHVRRAGAR